MENIQVKRSFLTYLHLNASFSDDIGFLCGKAGGVLFFSSLQDDYYKSEITFNFIEEILSQIGLRTPLSFGHGISGIGCLLEYLRRQQILDIDVNELVEDFEPHLLKSISSGLYSDLSLEHGLSGYGLYLLSRYNSGGLSVENEARIRECLTMTVGQVLDTANMSIALFTDPSLWTGISGIYMFLSHASGLMSVVPDEQIDNLISNIIQSITTSEPGWHQVPLWFVLLNCTSILPKSGSIDEIRTLFTTFLDWCSHTTETIHFTNAAFYGALLHYIYLFQNISECQLVSKKLVEMVNRVLGVNSLKTLFPYNPDKRSINMGLFQGVSGMALAMHSIENNDFGWMEILGYKNHYHTNNKSDL